MHFLIYFRKVRSRWKSTSHADFPHLPFIYMDNLVVVAIIDIYRSKNRYNFRKQFKGNDDEDNKTSMIVVADYRNGVNFGSIEVPRLDLNEDRFLVTSNENVLIMAFDRNSTGHFDIRVVEKKLQPHFLHKIQVEVKRFKNDDVEIFCHNSNFAIRNGKFLKIFTLNGKNKLKFVCDKILDEYNCDFVTNLDRIAWLRNDVLNVFDYIERRQQEVELSIKMTFAKLWAFSGNFIFVQLKRLDGHHEYFTM